MYVYKYPNCASFYKEKISSCVGYVLKSTYYFPLQVQYGHKESQPCSRLLHFLDSQHTA